MPTLVSIVSDKDPSIVATVSNNALNVNEKGQLLDNQTNSTQKTQIVDSSGTSAKVEARVQTPTGNALNVQIGPGDVISNIPVIMDYDHHQLHEGESFRWSTYTATFNKNTNKDIRLVVPNITIPVGVNPVSLCPHYRFECIYGDQGELKLYESTTFTGNGTQRTPIALERNGTYTPKLQIWEDPTVNAVGNLIWQGLMLGTKNNAGGLDTAANEFVLKNNTSYLLRFTSGTVDNVKLLIRMEWYEDLGV